MIAISARIWSFNLVALAILVMSSTFVDFEKFSKKMEKDKSWRPDGIKKEWERFKENPLIKKDTDPSTGIIRMQIPDLVLPPQARTAISSAELQTIFNQATAQAREYIEERDNINRAAKALAAFQQEQAQQQEQEEEEEEEEEHYVNEHGLIRTVNARHDEFDPTDMEWEGEWAP